MSFLSACQQMSAKVLEVFGSSVTWTSRTPGGVNESTGVRTDVETVSTISADRGRDVTIPAMDGKSIVIRRIYLVGGSVAIKRRDFITDGGVQWNVVRVGKQVDGELQEVVTERKA